MLNIKALRDQRADKAKAARNLLDTNTGDKWSKDIEAQVDAIYEEIDRIDAQIERAEKQARIDGDAAADEASQENRDRTIGNLAPAERERALAYQAAFTNFLIRGERGLTREEMETLRTGTPQNAQTIGTGAGGGYLVPAGFGGELLEALKEFGGMRDVATVIQTAGGAPLPWPTVDETGVIGEIVAENQPASDQDVTYGTTQIGAYKFSSKVRVRGLFKRLKAAEIRHFRPATAGLFLPDAFPRGSSQSRRNPPFFTGRGRVRDAWSDA